MVVLLEEQKRSAFRTTTARSGRGCGRPGGNGILPFCSNRHHSGFHRIRAARRPEYLLLCVNADERGRPGRVVGLAIDENVAVKGHPTGRGSFALLPHASGPLTVVSTGPTPVHVTSNVTSWVPPLLSRTIPPPV